MLTEIPKEKDKEQVSIDEKRPASELSYDVENGDEALRLVGTLRSAYFSDEYNAKLRRKLDLLIPPICAAVYFTQFLDKTSLNYASIMGLPIVGQNYNLVSAAFYVGFLVWEFPTMYLSQRTRIAKYLGVNVVLWGIILMLHAASTSFASFFALRFLLGMCESCVAPILILLISMFYKKSEQASRIAWFYVMNGLTQVFGGFIAYGVSFSDSPSILPYKILYILLGGLAILVGICVLIWLPDSPVQARFLTKEERIAALERVRNDQGGTENKHFKKEQVWEALTDIRTWLIVVTTLTTSIPNGGLSNFSNIIIRNFGYTSRQTLIVSTPAGLVAAVTTLLCGYYSDKKNERMTPIIFALVPTIIGSAILVGLNGSHQKGVLLFASYLIGTFGSSLAVIYAWNASNTSGHTKKVTINAITLVAFAIGNIAGAETFQPSTAPGYVPGKIAILVLLSAQIFISLLLRWVNLYLNRKKRRALEEEKSRRGWTDEDVEKERQKHAFLDMTDKQRKMEHSEIGSLSAKNLSHPRFQKHDNGRVREYLRDQKCRLKTIKLSKEPFESPGHEVVSKSTITGTGFSSPILRPRTERNYTKNTMMETEINVHQASKVSRTGAGQQIDRNDDVDNLSSRLEARRAKRKTRREIMRGEPPVVEKTAKNKLISTNSYSEMSLLQRFPPPNIKRGRLTLKPNNNPGFFRKGKTSIQILTSSGAASSFVTSQNDMLNKQLRGGTIGDSSVGTSNQVTTEIEGLEKTSKSKQIVTVSKACNRGQSTISELIVPCGGTALSSENTRPSSPVGPRPLRAYSDVWDIELDQSLPSDASSIQHVGSKAQGGTTLREHTEPRALSPVHMQRHVDETYPYSNVISTPPQFHENVMQKELYDNTFRWRPQCLQIVQQASPLYQDSRSDTPYFQSEIDTNFYWPRDPLPSNPETGIGNAEILIEKNIRPGEANCMDSFEQFQFGRNESEPFMLKTGNQPEIDECSYWEELSENSSFFGRLRNYDDTNALDAYAEQDSCSYSDVYYEGDSLPAHTVENVERGNEFEIDTNTDPDERVEGRSTQSLRAEPVTNWTFNATGPSLISASDLWSPEKELKKLLRNHWVSQKL